MDIKELFRLIGTGDAEASQKLYDTYGRKIYIDALERSGSERIARAVLKETFKYLIGRLKEDPEAEPAELWISSVAEMEIQSLIQTNVSSRALDTTWQEISEEMNPLPKEETEMTDISALPMTEENPDSDFDLDGYTYLQKDPPKRARKHRVIWRVLLVVLLILIMLFVIWGVLGLLMSNGTIDEIDIGYEWFNDHIFNLF